MQVYLSGRFVNKEDAKVSVFDHGFLYGDGIFEGIRLYNNCVFKLDEHLERLEMSAKALMLKMPWSRDEIAEAVCESCRVNNLKNGYVRLVVTRGVGKLGLSPKECSQPELIIIADDIQLYPQELYEKGLKIITVPTRRNSVASLSPHIKSLNYLNNVLAKMEAAQSGCAEAIFLNEQGYVAECSGDNIFLVHKGAIITPNASDGALKGITRDLLLEIAGELGIEAKIEQVTRYDLWNADEVFLSGTAAEIIPVVEVDGRMVGSGMRGDITARCLESFREKVSKEGRFL